MPARPPAYSYARFSTKEQAKGDSLRRQAELRDRWCERNGVSLDTARVMTDAGASAFSGGHRQNPDRHALAAFLQLVQAGHIPRGSYLIVESLDRLSREHVQPALMLVLGLLQAGVRVVQLLPSEVVYTDESDMVAVMMMLLELSRGHSESAMKSERVGRAWANKRTRAAAAGEVLTRNVPGWLAVTGGKFAVKPDAAAAVRRVFRMAADGSGVSGIVRALNAEGVRPLGRAVRWGPSSVVKLLGNRAAVGEHQPRKWVGPRRNVPGEPIGPPIPGYFPAVVSEAEFYAVQAAVAARRSVPAGTAGGRRGRGGDVVNLFSKIIFDARSGERLHAVGKPGKHGKRTHTLVPAHLRAAGPGVGAGRQGFDYATFEAAVLSLLREVNPADVLPKTAPVTDEAAELAGRRATVEARLAEVSAAMTDGNGDVKVLADAGRKLEAERAKLLDDEQAARRKAATPFGAALAEAQTLAGALEAGGPDARVRLAGLFRRLLSDVRVLVVDRGEHRLAAVRLTFADGGKSRDFLIVRRMPRGPQPAAWWARSFAGSAKLDFTNPAHVEKLAAALDRLDLGPLTAGPPGG